jgi:hypothetical protein
MSFPRESPIIWRAIGSGSTIGSGLLVWLWHITLALTLLVLTYLGSMGLPLWLHHVSELSWNPVCPQGENNLQSCGVIHVALQVTHPVLPDADSMPIRRFGGSTR